MTTRSAYLKGEVATLRHALTGFNKMIGLIDEMVANLKKEQEDENFKKAYCQTSLCETDDKKKDFQE